MLMNMVSYLAVEVIEGTKCSNTVLQQVSTTPSVSGEVTSLGMQQVLS